MAAKHSASPISYRAFFHGLGQIEPFLRSDANGSYATKAVIAPAAPIPSHMK
jgi:hypothetical protein